MAEALELQNTLVALLANMQKMSEDNKATKAVSYTHLDVYKRQLYV